MTRMTWLRRGTVALAAVASMAHAQNTSSTQGATPPPDPSTPDIVVTADRANSFSTDYVQAGTFRGARQIDTPLTVTVVS